MRTSIGIDRDIGRQLSFSVAYVGRRGSQFIGWTDVGGIYSEKPYPLEDGRIVHVFDLMGSRSSRVYRLTNPEGYSLIYNGLVVTGEKRRSHGWQASGSYTWSRTHGLQASSGTSASGPQISTVGAPPVSFTPPLVFGRDPNDLTYARGRLPNDRPHLVRVVGAADVPGSGIRVAANLQVSSGKPWAASALVRVAQSPAQRILIEPRGSQRLSSQTLLDVRLARPFQLGSSTRVELLLDILNLLNDSAEESVASGQLASRRLRSGQCVRGSAPGDAWRATRPWTITVGRLRPRSSRYPRLQLF